MSVFKSKENTMTAEDQQKKEHQDLETRAEALHTSVMSQNSEWLMKLEAEEKSQRGGFSFECSRFGNFLSINVRRKANAPEQEWQPELGYEYFQRSLNLKNINSISLKKGHATDSDGEVRYSQIYESGGYAVRPEFPYLPTYHIHYAERININTEIHGMMMCGSREHRIQFVSKPYARASKDDVIVFERVGELFVPFGLGEEVLAKIHAVT